MGALASAELDHAKAGCDCKQWPIARWCAQDWNDHSRCWGVCCRGEKGQRRMGAARKAPEFLSRGRLGSYSPLVGFGCCRTTGGGVRAWDEPSTAEAIATKRVHDLPMNRSACAAQCAALKGCTHFELNMYDQPVHSNEGVCSVFASGGFSVTTGCKDGSDRPRMHCFTARTNRTSTPHRDHMPARNKAASCAVCVVGQLARLELESKARAIARSPSDLLTRHPKHSFAVQPDPIPILIQPLSSAYISHG